MYSYSQLSLAFLTLATLSMKAMQQDVFIIKNFEQLTINAIHKPESLLTLCIKHFGRIREICQADGNTLGELLSPKSIIPENIALNIIKKFPNNVIKECAQEIAQRLSTALSAKMNIAFIDKLAECDAIIPCRTMLQQFMNDPKTSKEIKQCINHHFYPLFQNMKAFLIAQIYTQKLPEYRETIAQKQDENTALSPDRNYHAIICGLNIKISTIKDRQCIAKSSGHNGFINSVSWSPDSKYIVTGSRDNTAKIWTIYGQCIATLTGHKNWIVSVSWSPDGKYIATGSFDKTAKIWAIKNNEYKCIATLSGHTESIQSLSWAPDGKYIVTGSYDNTAKIWTIDGQCLATLTGHTHTVGSVSWSPDGKSLTTYSYDKTTRKWDMHLLNTITQHSFSYDEISLIQAIADAQKNNTMYPLNQQEQQIFDQLVSDNRKLRDALHGALDPLVNKHKLSKEID